MTITIGILGAAFTFFQLLASLQITKPIIWPQIKITKFPYYYIMLVSSILLVTASIWQYYKPNTITLSPNPCQTVRVQGSVSSDTVISQAPDGECIGISDGTFFFDKDLKDRPKNYNDLKLQVLQELKNGNTDQAEKLWRTSHVTNDAEMLIYLEDQRILASNSPSITIAVTTMVTGGYASVGRGILQGAYVAQKEYNSNCTLPNCTKVRLLIVNAGSGRGSSDWALYASIAANQIVQQASTFKIKAVLGWPYSGQTVGAIPVLGPAHIPIVSPSASSDSLTSSSDYFSRVVPPDTVQAIAGANYAKNTLKAKKVAVFYDLTDPYSRSLGEAFSKQFEAISHTTVIKELFTVGKTNDDQMGSLIRDSFRQAPDLDLIYYAGYVQDVSHLLNLLPDAKRYPGLEVMGGDGLYDPSDLPSGIYPPTSFGRMVFTAHAYSDQWQFAHLTNPPFFCDYTHDFDPSTPCPGPNTNKKYGYNRASTFSILTYDGLSLLLNASGKAISNLGINFDPPYLQSVIRTIKGNQAFQGVSGRISIDSNGNPINKAVVILRVDENGMTRMIGSLNCFSVQSHCGDTSP
ncbi:ABC transporter substrate-binding protein [Dictyobacter aurantiacus]|uniref:Leucine-binding protein domain-containing protein n=1 Tax=Dictyobacter aurantiacus TaxID=1936993 RepID=A0A401ZSJ3_9CHLR|nr:ABC transporter substrate-binding protein [Dictyobacter aurantiacus]GCE09782.1 hypothetical protein KDAU_71110 [Dictyobacter aurantiacus]